MESTGQLARGWIFAVVGLCIGSLALQFHHIDRTLPYPRHVDEGFVSGPAQRTLMTGNWHPYRFNYPSLPKYLAAAGMAAGFLRGAARQESRQIQRLGNVGYPYYDRRLPMQTARQLFAVLALLTMIATSMAAWTAFRTASTVLLAPLLLMLSPLFFYHSWAYLNVDLVGACFVMLTLAACLVGTRAPSILQSAVLPGAFAGLAAGSKYTLALAILPVLAGVTLYPPRGKRLLGWGCAIGAMILAFLLAVPYSIVDLPGFLDGVADEAFHYAAGHRGYQAAPGIPQLLYYVRHLLGEFGFLGVLLAACGFVACALVDWRRALVLAVFPAALLWLLMWQRVHFTRNVLAVQPFVAMFAAQAVAILYAWILPVARTRVPSASRWARMLPVVLAVALVLLTAPVWHVAGHLRAASESRNEVVPWILERVPPTFAVVVPTELGFDARPLEASERRVRTIDFSRLRDPSGVRALLDEIGGSAVVLAPRWGADPLREGQPLADALNESSRRWRVLETFGTNDVLVNFTHTVPWGDPAFAVAVLQ